MVRKSVLKKAKDYYPKPKEKPKEYLIMYHSPNRWTAREGVYWEAHGFKFEEGVVYRVSELVYEWSKGQRGFFQVKEIKTDKVVDFK